jgi:hypothetical protein
MGRGGNSLNRPRRRGRRRPRSGGGEENEDDDDDDDENETRTRTMMRTRMGSDRGIPLLAVNLRLMGSSAIKEGLNL